MNILAQTTASWTNWLPAFFQQPEAIFTVIVAGAAFGLTKVHPATDKWPWIPETASLISGVLVSCGLKVGGSYVYAAGFGVISAWGASSFYSLAFNWLTARLRTLFGQPASPDSGVKMVDANNLPKQPEPKP